MNVAALVFTFVLVNLQTGAREVVNPTMAQERVSPWSTYKIPHALIGLETGLLSGAEHAMKWDGVKRARPEWNRDQTLRSAVELSAVWYFQRLAAELGIDRERQWVAKIPYGNARVDGDVTMFWLGGSLRISALEEADFVRRLWSDALPFSKRSMAIARDILPSQKGAHGEVRAKTGSDGARRAWLVGHVEHDGAGWVFATRVDEPGANRDTVRALTEKLLRERHLWIE
jgi:beta-lactamase class D